MTTITPLKISALTTTLYMTVRRRLALFVVLALLIPLGAHLYRRCLAAGNELNQGQPFYVLSASGTASFVTRGATDIHLLSYFVQEKPQHEVAAPEKTAKMPASKNPEKAIYSLKLVFLTQDGHVCDHRDVQLALEDDEAPLSLPDGAVLAKVRLLPLTVPQNATILQITSPDGRVLLRANQLLPNHGNQEALLARSGRPVHWFQNDELQGLGGNGWAALPALYDLPSIKLPLMAQLEEDATEDAIGTVAPLRVEPHRALVWNVTGPGWMKLTVDSDDRAVGQYELEHIGAKGSGHLEMTGGRASINLPAGPSSITLRPLNSIGATVHIKTHNLHALGRSDEVIEPAGRLGSAWRVDEEKPLRFSFEGQNGYVGPVRLTARALDAQADRTLIWRLLDDENKELRRGELPLGKEYDLFTAFMMNGAPSDLGAAQKIFVTPSPDTAVLEVSAAGALVTVDMLLENGAEPQLLPPYDDPLPPTLRWHEVPVKSPRWLMLRPLSSKSEQRQIYAAMLRTPRIEGIGELPRGPWIPVTPTGVPKLARILEQATHRSPGQDVQTLVPTGQETALVLEPDGKNARRVVLNCDLTDKLGGELTLRIDGKKVAAMPITTSSVRLEANAPSGVHQVRIDGAPAGVCMVAARPASGAVTVRRTVYQMVPKDGLVVKLAAKRNAPVRLHYAIYSEHGGTHKDVPFAVTIDGGSPKRRIGSSDTFTIAQSSQKLQFASGNFEFAGKATESPHGSIAISAVQLGADLGSGSHRIVLRPLTSGKYWARFWIEGRRHRLDAADSFITTDPTTISPELISQNEVEE